MRFSNTSVKLLSFLRLEGGRGGFPAAFFFVLLCLLAIPLWAGEPAGEKPASPKDTAKTAADASESDRERVNAASLLAESGDPKAIESLFAVIRDLNEKPLLRAAMIHGLSKSPQKTPVAAFLVKRLQDHKEAAEVRAAAASALGGLGISAGKESLRRASSDQNPMVRQAARQSLLTLDGEGVDRAGLLIAALKDTEQRAAVRAGAARQLGDLRDMRALQPLILALREKSPDIPNPQTPKEIFAARSLAKEHLPASAARALRQLGSRDAIAPLLANAQTQDNEFRTAIFESLAMLKASEAVPIARKVIISDTDHRVRRWAGVILKDAGDKEALPELLKALKDTDPGVRLQAAQAIGNVKDCKAIKKLEKALAMEENKEVKEAMENTVQGLKESKTK